MNSEKQKEIKQRNKRRVIVFVIAVIFGFFGRDGLCIFLGIMIVADIIQDEITKVLKEMKKLDNPDN